VCDADADDLVQDAYCRLATLRSIDHIDRPGAYFMQIVKNLRRDRLRRERIIRFEELRKMPTCSSSMKRLASKRRSRRASSCGWWAGCWRTCPTGAGRSSR
jgi:DNA-directed RNA polymerase specialized sigma24 family protein